MHCVAFAVLLPIALAAEGDSNADIEFVQRQLTGLYTVTPTSGDTNGGQFMLCRPNFSSYFVQPFHSVYLHIDC